jgi:fido (protein-threonine AMPylation protein)
MFWRSFGRRATLERPSEHRSHLIDLPVLEQSVLDAVSTQRSALLLYPWAGELRTVQIAKPNAFYARPEHIAVYAQGIFAELAREDCLKGLDHAAFLGRLTHYYAEMYAVHPFREGNTRSLRAFLGQLAREAGHRIAWEHLDHERSFAANWPASTARANHSASCWSRSSTCPF